MTMFPEGDAIIWAEGAFTTPNGKTAHGLVRRTKRYRVRAVVDSSSAGHDAGELLDGAPVGIPIVASIDEALALTRAQGTRATHLVVGVAPDGGRLDPVIRGGIVQAIQRRLDVDCGLHDLLGDDPALVALARQQGVQLRDVRRGPPRQELHFFTGAIEEVGSLRIALLGTDSAVGKRTTAWMLVDALVRAGVSTALIGTGQTSWFQGVAHGIVLDALINDFVAGEIEHAICTSWRIDAPRVMVLEGQGSLMNPAYPGGHELLAAGRPHMVIMQHAPARREYDGFPGYPLHPLPLQIQAVELLSERPVVAVTLNHEGLDPDEIDQAADELTSSLGRPAVDPFVHGLAPVVDLVTAALARHEGSPR